MSDPEGSPPAPAGAAMPDLDELGRQDVQAELELADLALERALGGLERVLPPALTDFLA